MLWKLFQTQFLSFVIALSSVFWSSSFAWAQAPTITRWANPSNLPRLLHHPLRASHPLHLQNISLSSSSRVVFPDMTLGRICIVVHRDLYDAIRANLEQYESDISDMGFETIVYLYDSGSPEDVRRHLASLYEDSESLVGAVLIGDIPYIVFEQMEDVGVGVGEEYADFPCDIFFMDLDGTWSDVLEDRGVHAGNGKYDTRGGNHYLEIWVSRIKTDNLRMLGVESDIINTYLQRNHAYRIGELQPEPNILIYNDDDWVDLTIEDRDAVENYYNDESVFLVSDPEETTSASYMFTHMNRRTLPNYELMAIRSHGSPDGHGFYRNGRAIFDYVLPRNYLDMDPTALFYSLFVCSGSDYTANNYLAGMVVFNTDNSGLLAWGSTKTGGMWGDRFFYEELGDGEVFGEAFRYWYNEVIYFYPEEERVWWYGMVLIGDGALRRHCDNDLDGFREVVCDGSDCNDRDADINPGAEEICDGVDNDCNPRTRDGADEIWLGDDCDGPDSDLCAEGAFLCTDGDQVCTDTTRDNIEVCDGEDNDCNPDTPDGAVEPWLGDDCDGPDSDLCTEGVFTCVGGDRRCTDTTDDIVDVCDGEDNDCNPDTSDGADEPWFGDDCDGPDSDLCAEGALACASGEQWCTDTTDDAVEVCDGEDNDCDLVLPDDELDSDFDGFMGCEGDCDDSDEMVFPGATELCNGVDDDCDPTTADGADESWLNSACDGSDSDLCEEGVWSCVEGGQVCLDDTADSTEVCNGNDDDCDGELPDDESDADGDGQMPCEGDCDDADATVYLDAIELCDGTDNDCDGVVPDVEIDGDGDRMTECQGDCDDSNPDTYAGAEEVDDGEDNDCDGEIPARELGADGDADADGDGDGDDGEHDDESGGSCSCRAAGGPMTSLRGLILSLVRGI